MAANEIRGLRLDFLAGIRVTGTDADAFLQGQFSNDIRRLTPELGQISSYSNPKGRVLAVLHLLRRSDGIHLELHRSVMESVLKRLRMFVLRSKVTLEIADMQSLGVFGDDAAEFLRSTGLPCPQTPLACASNDNLTVMRRIGTRPRYSVHGSESALAEIEKKLPAATANDWLRADIEAGVPTVYPETQDRFVPQWCNLDTLGGIAFDKGCYTGQEIVARIHYLGEVKRRMHSVTLPAVLPPGADSEHGEIVVSAALPDGSTLALAIKRT